MRVLFVAAIAAVASAHSCHYELAYESEALVAYGQCVFTKLLNGPGVMVVSDVGRLTPVRFGANLDTDGFTLTIQHGPPSFMWALDSDVECFNADDMTHAVTQSCDPNSCPETGYISRSGVSSSFMRNDNSTFCTKETYQCIRYSFATSDRTRVVSPGAVESVGLTFNGQEVELSEVPTIVEVSNRKLVLRADFDNVDLTDELNGLYLVNETLKTTAFECDVFLDRKTKHMHFNNSHLSSGLRATDFTTSDYEFDNSVRFAFNALPTVGEYTVSDSRVSSQGSRVRIHGSVDIPKFTVGTVHCSETDSSRRVMCSDDGLVALRCDGEIMVESVMQGLNVVGTGCTTVCLSNHLIGSC